MAVHCFCWWGCKLVQPLWKTVFRLLKQLKIELLLHLVLPLLGIYPKKMKTLFFCFVFFLFVFELQFTYNVVLVSGIQQVIHIYIWRRKWQPTPVFLPGKSHGQRSWEGYSPWNCKRVGYDLVTEYAHMSFTCSLCSFAHLVSLTYIYVCVCIIYQILFHYVIIRY